MSITPKKPRKRELACNCCGGMAGRFVQWFNQDTGYSICRSCLDGQYIARGESAATIRDYFGVEGVNYAASGFALVT